MKCPNGENHVVELKTISPTLNYEYCTVCKEDVEYLANQNQPAAQVEAAANDEDQDEDLDDEDFEDDFDDQDDDDDQGVYVAPAAHNPHPVQNLGNAAGTHQIVLMNDPNTGAHLVEQVLRSVFAKDYQESQYLMLDCHYKGRAVCSYVTEQEAEVLLQQIEAKKQEIAASGCVGANTIDNLRFVVERRPT